MAIRIVKANRTVSHDAALTLAGMTPFSMLAKVDTRIFHQVQPAQDNGETTRVDTMRMRRQALELAQQEWKQKLENGYTVKPVIQRSSHIRNNGRSEGLRH